MPPRVQICMFSRLLSAASSTDVARPVPSSQNCIDILEKFAPQSSFGLNCGGMQSGSCRKDQPRSHAEEMHSHKFGAMQKGFSHCQMRRKACSRTSRLHA